MRPFLIEIGSFRLPTYGVLLCIAILVGIWMAVRRAERHGLSHDFVYSTATLAVLGALIGSKLTDWLRFGEAYSWESLLTSAGTFLGGFLAAFGVTAFTAWRSGNSFWRIGDTFAASLGLGVAVVRVGCFAASCDYGKPTELPWGVVFTSTTAARFTGVPLGVRLHPSQLYESLLGLAILATILLLERKQRAPGVLFLTFVTLYSVGRFLLEFLRGDVDRGFWGPLSTSQWLSLLLLGLTYCGYWVTEKRRSTR